MTSSGGEVLARISFLVLASAALFAASAQAAQAERYCARLGAADHFNSSGKRLGTVGAIVQQDRANFHEQGVRDPGDQDDPIFHDKVSRAALGRMLDGNEMSPEDRRAILNGQPMICVRVEGDFARIYSVR